MRAYDHRAQRESFSNECVADPTSRRLIRRYKRLETQPSPIIVEPALKRGFEIMDITASRWRLRKGVLASTRFGLSRAHEHQLPSTRRERASLVFDPLPAAARDVSSDTGEFVRIRRLEKCSR